MSSTKKSLTRIEQNAIILSKKLKSRRLNLPCRFPFLPVSCLQVAKWELVLLPDILKFKRGDYLKIVKCVW